MPFNLGYPAHQFDYDEPGQKCHSLQDFFAAFPTDDACLLHVFERRFGPSPRCAKCGDHGSWHKTATRRVIQHSCGMGVSPLAGTLMHASNIPAHIWFYAMLHFANSSESVSAVFLRRQLGVGHLASVRIAQRIRLHLAAIDRQRVLGAESGVVLVRLEMLRRVMTSGRRRNYTQVLAMGDGRHALSVVVPYPQPYRLKAALVDKVGCGVELLTDCERTSRAFLPIARGRPFVRYAPKGVPGLADTAKGFFTRFRHALVCQHGSVREEYLWRYLKEYEFRYNRRFASDRIFPEMIASFPELTAPTIAELEKRNSMPPPSNKMPLRR